jgi:(2Fe-2S) ferredoxin
MKIANLSQLKEIKEKGLRLTYPEKIKIMVGMATCGISAGAEKVYRALEKKIAETKLDVVLEKTGCIGFCQVEPLVDVVYPKRVRVSYQGMTPEKAEKLVEALTKGEFFPENAMCRIDREEFVVEGISRP